MSFLCEWDSRARDKNYFTKRWKKRDKLSLNGKNIIHEPIVEPRKPLLPPLNIKLGLMKHFVEAVKKYSAGFLYIRQKFPNVGERKVKEGISFGPQVKELLKDDVFNLILNNIAA